MNIVIISVGKKHSSEFADAIAMYEKRFASKHAITWSLINPAIGGGLQQVDEESYKILNSLKPTDYVILLDETGNNLSNQQFAKIFDQTITDGSIGRIVFIIGGAFGVNAELKARAHYVWSLSKLVFPHQLVRLILIEQLYRTVSILNNHPYHHQ